ncbi:M48 family metallopeptidase [Spongorhabdus nitratireducens]
MEYQNPKIPEGINVSQEHPLKDFFIMLLGAGLIIAGLIFTLTLLAGSLVRYVPFELEQQLAASLEQELVETETVKPGRHQQYLQNLADRLVIAQQLPEAMKITVHYMDGDEVNAFATLGGHIFVYRGLLEKMPNENALAMVLAHEIAHIKHRDPLVATGRGLTVGLALMSLAGIADSALAQQVISQVSLLTTLGFSREMERAADNEALLTLKQHYGHTLAADTVFQIFNDLEDGQGLPAFLSTHPQSTDRIEVIDHFQHRHGSHQGTLTPLPSWFNEP